MATALAAHPPLPPVGLPVPPEAKGTVVRKRYGIGAVVGAALAVAATTAAISSTPASGTVTAANAAVLPASIRPGTPARAPGGHSLAPAFVTNSRLRSIPSSNWAGYAAYNGPTTFRYVSAHFYVPRLDCAGVSATNPTYSSHWVGLDGFASSTAEQVGVLAACLPNASNVVQPVYAAWFERFPFGPAYPNITVRPGDSISVKVYFNRSTRKFQFALSDLTNRQGFSYYRYCPSGSTCRRNSAEVISEAPSGSSGILPLADFQAAGFASAGITETSGAAGGLRSSHWNTYRIVQESDGTNPNAAGNPIPAGTVLDPPTPLYQRRAFLDYWTPASG